MAEAWYLKELREREKKLKKALEELENERDKRKEVEEENKDLKRQLKEMAMAKEAKRPRFPDYSLQKHEKHNATTGRSTGRIPFAEKLKTVQFEKNIYPENVTPEQCILASQRIVTRLNEGKKEVWLYNIHRKKWGTARGKLPEVFGKSEYGVEVVIILAFLVYVLKLSQDQSRAVLSFFCGIKMGKSQIESLLNQLGERWEKEFDTVADLMVLSLLVHVDETGWKIGKKNCYTWIFKSLTHTLLLYGEKREEEVLDRILPWKKFKGTGITDCYKIYEKRFSSAQKCWAHFLRKAIKLMLLHPENEQYNTFFKDLYEIFKDAKELKERQENKEKGINDLEKRIEKVCTEKNRKLNKETAKDLREYVNLHKLLIKNIKDLFTFVRLKEVEPTNNQAERGFRHVARSRNNYQTSKSQKGAKRHSIITSVLFSLKQNMPEFSLATVTAEIIRWQVENRSLFKKQAEQTLGQSP
jgi:hypothetical protein